MAPTIITTTPVPAAKPSTGQLYDLVDLATVKAVLNTSLPRPLSAQSVRVGEGHVGRPHREPR
jgi:hypothetical protein